MKMDQKDKKRIQHEMAVKNIFNKSRVAAPQQRKSHITSSKKMNIVNFSQVSTRSKHFQTQGGRQTIKPNYNELNKVGLQDKQKEMKIAQMYGVLPQSMPTKKQRVESQSTSISGEQTAKKRLQRESKVNALINLS